MWVLLWLRELIIDWLAAGLSTSVLPMVLLELRSLPGEITSALHKMLCVYPLYFSTTERCLIFSPCSLSNCTLDVRVSLIAGLCSVRRLCLCVFLCLLWNTICGTAAKSVMRVFTSRCIWDLRAIGEVMRKTRSHYSFPCSKKKEDDRLNLTSCSSIVTVYSEDSG